MIKVDVIGLTSMLGLTGDWIKKKKNWIITGVDVFSREGKESDV